MCAYYIPPLNTNNKFNSSSFNFQDKYINFHQGDSRYLLKNQYTGTGSTGARGLGCQIVNTQLFDNVVATTSSFSGSGIPTNWTKSYTSIGGNLLIFCNFSCFASTPAQYNFNLYIDGAIVDTCSFVFNTASFNETVPSIFHVNNPLSIGSHTIAISIPGGITVNNQNFLNMTIQETISATVLASTGPTGNIGSTGMIGPQGLGCQIVNTQLFDNQVATTGANYTGAGIPTLWTKSYISIGGNLLIFCNFVAWCYTTVGTYTFSLYIDGVSVDTTSFIFNQLGLNETIPAMFHVNVPLSVGAHTIAIYIPLGTAVNDGNFLNMTIQETISATILASTGPTGNIGSTGMIGPQGLGCQIKNTQVYDNVGGNNTSGAGLGWALASYTSIGGNLLLWGQCQL